MTKPTDTELKDNLTPLQYRVTQEAGTERPFSGVYWNSKEPGTYLCVVCESPLFTSDTKYDSGTGWPSFWEPISDSAVDTKRDFGGFMVRTEAVCSDCGAHLGHVFKDGPNPTGLRYCMNSASLKLEEAEEAD